VTRSSYKGRTRGVFSRPPQRRKRRKNRGWWELTTEEIYVYRCRKPYAPLGKLGFLSRHFAYGGRTVDPKSRDKEHLIGGKGRFGYRAPQPWSDLEPKRYVVFKMKTRTKGMTSLLERVVIRGLFCVYNHQFNLANPRRISLSRARWQRVLRDKYGRSAMTGELIGRWLVPLVLSIVGVYLWSRS
jgi:hypothetical protein